ncbi:MULTISPECIES: LysR family transcriptional regulator [Vagococcus]|uniref:Cys regulon transcriptional activator CysB n=1 Tax=Vagococcus fluvialis bH819 TaxID=1255619 RepID=A0A1X6WQJ7_9ENTE|nr:MULTISPECIES: LysR family transcriptional regulator [Vagococcus]SLM86621.1 Cys regulon transcriptional activator CysB [Vagococcus fluvialis bH819]HCM90829.1 LysR family transcriptional regulator [Vagococcus sp.]
MVNKLDLYRVFYEVSQHKSFSKAAKTLYLTQPAVSQSIAQLEQELSVRLFNRNPQGVILTEEGKLLHDYVYSALNLLDSGEKKMEEFKLLKGGKIAIGVGDTISRYFLLPFLESFHQIYPEITFKLVNGTTSELIETLKQGKIDIAICNFPIEDEKLEKIHCADIQDTFVYGSKYVNDFVQPLTIEEVIQYPIICLDQDSISRRFIDNYLKEKKLSLKPEFELGSHDLLLDFAKINLGIACVTKEFSQAYIDQGLLQEIRLIEQIPKRSIGLCYLKSVSLSLASQKFVQVIINNKKSL